MYFGSLHARGEIDKLGVETAEVLFSCHREELDLTIRGGVYCWHCFNQDKLHLHSLKRNRSAAVTMIANIISTLIINEGRISKRIMAMWIVRCSGIISNL